MEQRRSKKLPRLEMDENDVSTHENDGTPPIVKPATAVPLTVASDNAQHGAHEYNGQAPQKRRVNTENQQNVEDYYRYSNSYQVPTIDDSRRPYIMPTSQQQQRQIYIPPTYTTTTHEEWHIPPSHSHQYSLRSLFTPWTVFITLACILIFHFSDYIYSCYRYYFRRQPLFIQQLYDELTWTEYIELKLSDAVENVRGVCQWCWQLRPSRLWYSSNNARAFRDNIYDSLPPLEETPFSDNEQFLIRTTGLMSFDISQLEPAFPSLDDYPPGWKVYHPKLGIVDVQRAYEHEDNKKNGVVDDDQPNGDGKILASNHDTLIPVDSSQTTEKTGLSNGTRRLASEADTVNRSEDVQSSTVSDYVDNDIDFTESVTGKSCQTHDATDAPSKQRPFLTLSAGGD